MKKYTYILAISLTFFLSLSSHAEDLKGSINQQLSNLENQFLGQKISKISFLHASNLSYDKLYSFISLKLGSNLQPAQIKKSHDSLLEKGGFSKARAEVSPYKSGVLIKFHLSLKKVISDVRFHGAKGVGKKILAGYASSVKGIEPSKNILDDFEQKVINFLNEEGYLNAKAQLSVKSKSGLPYSRLKVKITLGEKALIEEIILPADLPEDLVAPVKLRQESFLLKTANKENIENLRKSFVQACRSEGYLQASVPAPGKVAIKDKEFVSLNFSILTGSPLSLIFRGNKEFTPSELLAPLKLETRTVPFGPSAIQNLIKEIKRLYQSEGYFNIIVNSSRLEDKGRRKNYLIEINEGRRFKADIPEFKGNKFAKDSELLKLFQSFSGQGVLAKLFFRKKIVTDYLEEELTSIVNFYKTQGFLDVEVKLEQFIRKNKLKTFVLIEEGKQYQVKSINYEKETEQIFNDFSLPKIELKPPFTYSSEILGAEISRLSRLIQEAGFPNSSLKIKFEPESEVLNISANLGQRIKINKITIQGNLHTKDKVIERALQIKAGELYDPNKIRLSQQNLYRLGHFRNVQIVPEDGALDSNLENLVVSISEIDTANITAGVGYHSEDGFRALAELRQGNLFGQGNTGTIGFDAYFNEGPRIVDAGNARALYKVPNLQGSPFELKVEGFFRFQIQQIDQFSYDRTGGQIGLEYPVSEKVKLSTSVLSYYEDVFDVEEAVNISDNDSGSSFYNFLNLKADYDFRDDPYLPSSGGRSILTLRFSEESLGSEVSFAGLSFKQSYFQKLSSNLIWANSIRGQMILPFADTQTIPLSQRLFLGGRNSLRGYSLASIGPRIDNGLTLGGDKNIVINSEFQLGLTENITAVVFIDAGRAYLDNYSFNETDNPIDSKLRYSPGLGIRYLTPIGPVSFDYGFATKREEGEDFGRINLGIGLIF